MCPNFWLVCLDMSDYKNAHFNSSKTPSVTLKISNKNVPTWCKKKVQLVVSIIALLLLVQLFANQLSSHPPSPPPPNEPKSPYKTKLKSHYIDTESLKCVVMTQNDNNLLCLIIDHLLRPGRLENMFCGLVELTL